MIRWERLRLSKVQVGIFVLGMAATAVVVILAAAILSGSETTGDIRADQQKNSPLIRNTSETLKRVQSCTTPGRRCYERGQRQTAKAVGDINRVIIIAASCASGPVERTVEDIARCVSERLARP